MSTSVAPRIPATRTLDPKIVGIVTLALVFLCGAALGAILMDLGLHKVMHQPAFDTPQGKVRFFERMQKELDLSPTQAEQMQSVLNDFWQYYRSVLTESKSRVEQILTEQQRHKFEQLLQDAQSGGRN